jgi:hypothetical protein
MMFTTFLYVYDIVPAGHGYFIAWQMKRNPNTNLGGDVVDRFITKDIASAKRWCMAQMVLDTDPWEMSYADERKEARTTLQELHELEKKQDRYRIHN